MRRWIIASLAVALAQPANAEMVKSQFTAPNGVIVDVATDDFAGRKEYASPFVNVTADGGGAGKAIVGEVFNDGKLRGLTVQGYIVYSGDWRFYTTAIYRGGAEAKYHRMHGDVAGCSSYGGCTLSETFIIDLTREEAKAHSTDGVVGIQLRSQRGQTALLMVPLSYVEAVASVAGVPAESDAAADLPVTTPPPPVAATPATKKPSQPTRKKPMITCVTCSGD